MIAWYSTDSRFAAGNYRQGLDRPRHETQDHSMTHLSPLLEGQVSMWTMCLWKWLRRVVSAMLSALRLEKTASLNFRKEKNPKPPFCFHSGSQLNRPRSSTTCVCVEINLLNYCMLLATVTMFTG